MMKVKHECRKLNFNEKIKIMMSRIMILTVEAKLKVGEKVNKQPDFVWSICIVII